MNKSIVIGGGCFWGLQDLIQKQVGVIMDIRATEYILIVI